MIDFILFLLGMVPWPVWAVLALVAVCLVQFVWGWRATIAAVISLLPVLGYFWGRKEGVQIEKSRQSKVRDNLQEHYDEIDRRPTDPGSAYDSLRKRSGGR